MSELITEQNLYLFNEGTQYRGYGFLGAQLSRQKGKAGTQFSVWAPAAAQVQVIGDFNHWGATEHLLDPQSNSGIWSGFIKGAKKGDHYRYRIKTHQGEVMEKSDPYAFYFDVSPANASRVWSLDYNWNDSKWIKNRKAKQAFNQPMTIYEMHLGSWRRGGEDKKQFLFYRELAEVLPAYLNQMGFTHVEFLPAMEHPFYGSWGYQTTGYFAPTSRYGNPQEFMELVDALHVAGIGVILDWVPSHFPADEFALSRFNGTHLYEHQDPRLGFHPDWNSLIFNYGRHEVKSFLISSALFWLDKYHIDGLRVDAVASMLYLDYSRREGEWIPNQHGGRENLEAIQFLRDLNDEVSRQFPDVHMIAEESTAWPKVSSPTNCGGLGFSMKWDMGWMHDSLEYFKRDPIFRSHHQGQLSFRSVYAFHENFTLSLSHDEVVHGKGSLIQKMPGDLWQKFANLRLLYSYMYSQPGKKLLFMGGEFAQFREWNHDESLDWHLLESSGFHSQLQKMVQELNYIYREQNCFYETDFSPEGFQWLDASDQNNCVFSYFRRSLSGEVILCVFNMTGVVRNQYVLGVDEVGEWQVVLNTDDARFGGSGCWQDKKIKSVAESSHGRRASLNLTLPPLAALYLKLL